MSRACGTRCATRCAATRAGLAKGLPRYESGLVNLHDWIDELCDALDIETEVDEALVLDLARDAAHNVERRSAPITTYLLGYAAAAHRASPSRIEALAGAAAQLADSWDRPADAVDPEAAIDDEIPDDSTVDHTGEYYEA